jgi:hypothetical protein
MQKLIAIAALSLFAGLVGCEGRPAIIPNKDASLRKTSAQLAADSAKRNYEADAPKGGEVAGRAEVDYTLKAVHLANLSPDDWENVEIWINQKYVVYIPKLPHDVKGSGYRHLNFQMFYDNNGQHIPISAFGVSKIRVEKVELCMEGKMFDVPVRLAD